MHTVCQTALGGQYVIPVHLGLERNIIARSNYRYPDFNPKLAAGSAHARARLNTGERAMYRVQIRLNLTGFVTHLPIANI